MLAEKIMLVISQPPTKLTQSDMAEPQLCPGISYNYIFTCNIRISQRNQPCFCNTYSCVYTGYM